MTDRQIIFEYLQTHDSITTLQAFNKFGISRLSAVIYDLRHKKHLNIEREMIEVYKRGERTARVARYRLVEDG